MKNKIFNSNSIYQLLLFLLLTRREERDLFIVGDAFPEKVRKNLDNSIFVGNDMVRFDSENKVKYLFNYVLQLIKLRQLYHSKLKFIKDKEIYGATIFAPLFAKDNIVYVLEDGTGSYVKKEDLGSSFFWQIKKYLHRIFLGTSDNFNTERQKYTSKIFYTGIGTIPSDVLPKAEIINIQQLWDDKNDLDKNEILRIFNIQPDVKDKVQNRSVILFTQTLNEDKLVQTEEEKIEIYRKALTDVDYSTVIIKPHPRETTDYAKFFPGTCVLDGQLPFQLLSLNGVKLKKAITLFSTAALSLDADVEIKWYGTSLSKTLAKKYGSIPISKFR